MTGAGPGPVTVVLCARRPERWPTLVDAVRLLRAESPAPAAVVVVVPAGSELCALAAHLDGVEVVEHHGEGGLAAARNAGLARCRSPIVAFLEDDTVPGPGWLGAMASAFMPGEVLVATSTVTLDVGEAGRPPWLPPGAGWLYGAGSGVGGVGPAFAVRASVVDAVGGFRSVTARIGGDDTAIADEEFVARIRAKWAEARIVRAPGATVVRRLPRRQLRYRAHLRRCRDEGRVRAVRQRLFGDELAAGVGPPVTAPEPAVRSLLPPRPNARALLAVVAFLAGRLAGTVVPLRRLVLDDHREARRRLVPAPEPVGTRIDQALRSPVTARVALALLAVVAVLDLTGVRFAARPFLALVVLATVPGLALVRTRPLEDPVTAVALVVGVSLAVSALVASALVWLGVFSGLAGLLVVGALSLPGLLVANRRTTH